MSIPYLSDNRKEFFACGTPITINEDPDGLLITWDGGEMKIPSDVDIFGGTDTYSDGKGVVDYELTSIVMNSGTVNKSIWGSNKGPGTINKVTMIMNGGEVKNGFSAGCSYGANIVPDWKSAEKGITYIKETHVTINGGKVYIVYGGTGSGTSKVDKANFTMTGGEAQYVTGGNSNGTIKAVSMKVTGGKTTSQLSSCMRGTCGNIDMKVTGGEHAYVSVQGDMKGSITGKSEVGIYGGTITKFMILDGIENKNANPELIKNMTVKAAPGLLAKEDQVDAITEDATLGEGAEMKTIRIYPFPHKSKRLYGILTNGKAIEMPAELPMSEQEIRFALGMGHVYEVIGDKLVVLDEHNYRLDNSNSAEFTGELPCNDCEISYPRAEEAEEEEHSTGNDSTEDPAKGEDKKEEEVPSNQPAEKKASKKAAKSAEPKVEEASPVVETKTEQN